MRKKEKEQLKEVTTTDTNNKTSKNNKTKKEKIQDFLVYLLFIGCQLIVAFTAGYKLCEYQTTNKNEEKVIDTVVDEETGMEVNLIEKDLSTKEITETSEVLLNTLNYIKNNNGYIQCRTGEGDEDYITYMYNKNGEIFRQNQSEFTVFRNDGTCIVFDDYATVTKDADVISIAEKVLEASTRKDKTENIEFKQVEVKSDNLGSEISNESLGYNAYVVNVNSYEEVENIYNYLGIDEYTEEVIAELKDLYGEDKQPELKYYFTISTDSEINEQEDKYPDFSFSCRMVYEEEEYTQWSVEGYMLVNDWKLSDNWYTSEFDNEEEIIALIEELSTDIEKMFTEFAEQYGLDINDLIDTGTTEDIENSEENYEETFTEVYTIEYEEFTEVNETEVNETETVE